MRTSNLLLATLREAPADAEIASHRLMLRAGLIRQIAAGIYSWLPLGLRVLHKVERIVRDEMDRSGAQEVSLPGVQPAELWQESRRWDQYGPELLRFRDRHDRDFCLGPTHEEIITDLARREIRSYRQLPVNLYQIQTKFRDEIRPRFGIMRAREFLMKDAYSFHLTQESLEETYDLMYRTYCRIFDRIGLDYCAVLADTGNIGGTRSHEFHVLAESGEDRIVLTGNGGYAANIEMTPVPPPSAQRPAPAAQMNRVATPGQHTIEEVCSALGVTPDKCVKTLVVIGKDGGPVALVLRGDHELNRIKAEALPAVRAPLAFAGAETVRASFGCDAGSLGPRGIRVPMYVDRYAAAAADFACGANETGFHLTGVNWGRDLPEPQCADLRHLCAGETAPDGRPARIARGIEVGHIFQLGTKYSAAMKAQCMDEDGRATTLIMGCYGIGVSRIVAAAIEQNHDEHGIVWPASIAPWEAALVPINMHKSGRLRAAVESLYQELTAAGIDVLLDDRRERPGVMFADIELLGIPHRVVFSEKGLDAGTVEHRTRRETADRHVPVAEIRQLLQAALAETRPARQRISNR
jgi:prolyl-tRNA synthetase